MNATQIAYWAAEIEKQAEELGALAHALIMQTRQIQEQAARQMPVPDGPEVTE